MTPGMSKKGQGPAAPKAVEVLLAAFQELEQGGTSFDALFQTIKGHYESLGEPEKEDLFRALTEQIEVPKAVIAPHARNLLACDQHDPRWPGMVTTLRSHLYSPRLRLFRALSRAPGGLKFLLDFRGDVLSARRYSTYDLGPLDSDIVFLFEMWFQEGFLYLEEITLDSAYQQIALIKDRDLVHPMASIEEMGQRLGRDRRCFALYHRLLPYEPIVFIEVALTEGIVKNISEIIAQTEGVKGKGRIDTAMFYSINNTQNGLAGLGMGKMLIGKVVEYLKGQHEEIRTFATLSPLPGFWANYLHPLLEGRDEGLRLKHSEIISFFPKKTVGKILEHADGDPDDRPRFNRALHSILSNASWAQDEELKKDLQGPLVKIAYQYLAHEKNRHQKPLNPVAGFHLGNGATISPKHVNFLGNPSERGLRESCGFMANYLYSSSWLAQLRRSIRWFDRMELRGLFTRRAAPSEDA